MGERAPTRPGRRCVTPNPIGTDLDILTRAPDAVPVKVLHVDAESGFSGGEVQVFLQIEELARRGVTNVLAAPADSRALQEARARGIAAEPVSMRGDLSLGSVLRLRSILKSGAFDVVHLHTGRATWLGGMAAWLAGVPAITTRRMDRRVKRGWKTRLIYGRFVRCVAAISPGVRDGLRAAGIPDERIHLVPDAIDPHAWAPVRSRDDVRRELQTSDEAFVVLTCGVLERRKGHDVLLEAATRLPDVHVWIAGAGSEAEALAEQVERTHLADRVQLLGARKDVADLLGACDLVAMPSRAEGLGVAALEALAAGRAVVASRVGGLADLIQDDRTGRLVPPEDAPALASAIERFASDPELLQRCGREGPTRVSEGFLVEQMVDAYMALYRELAPGASA